MSRLSFAGNSRRTAVFLQYSGERNSDYVHNLQQNIYGNIVVSKNFNPEQKTAIHSSIIMELVFLTVTKASVMLHLFLRCWQIFNCLNFRTKVLNFFLSVAEGHFTYIFKLMIWKIKTFYLHVFFHKCYK